MDKTIILLTNTYPFSEKGETFIHSEVEVLSKLAHKIYIIPREGDINPDHEIQLPSNVTIYPLQSIGKIHKFAYFMSSPGLVFHLIKEILKEFNNRKYALRYATKAIRGTYTMKHIMKKEKLNPSQVILYSYWFHFNALAVALYKGKVYKKIARAHGYDFYKDRAIQVFKEFTAKKVDHIYAASETAMNYIQTEYNADNVYTSLLGVNNDFHLPKFQRGKSLRLVSCSRLIELKRVNLIIDVLASIDDIHITWTHMGGGDSEKAIQEYARQKLDHKSNIQYKLNGHLTNSDVYELYKNDIFDLFITLSSTEGGAPVSVQEAQSFAIPVIATNVGGISALVNEKTGKRIDSIDEKEIIRQGVKAIRDYNQLSTEQIVKVRENCRAHWRENFDAQIVYRKFFQRIQED